MKKLFYIVALATLLLSACGKDAAPKEEAGNSSNEMTVERVVESVVNDHYTVVENEGNVAISIQDTDIRQGSKSQMLKDSTKIFSELAKIKSVKSPLIIWYAPLTEEDGNEDMHEVMRISFDEKSFKKINWANYKELNIEASASEYKQSDAIGD